MSQGRLQDKIALITGASRGIGAAIAEAYAREGAHMILVGRTVGALEEVDDAIQAAGGQATLVPQDLLKHEMIDALGQQIAAKFGRLDILVGNAGMLGELSPIAHTAPEIWEQVIALNLTANYRLLRSMDPLLRRAKSAHVQFVTSGVARMDAPFWGAYAVSKAGLEKLARTYAAENQQASIDVRVIDPGVVRTHMRALAFPGENPETLPAPDDPKVLARFFDALGLREAAHA